MKKLSTDKSNTIVLYTIQSPSFYQAGKVLTTLPEKEDPFFKSEYAIMLDHYQKQVNPHAKSLVWFFADREPLAFRQRVAKRKPAVLIRCRIPQNQLLATNFSEWNIILNHQNLLFANADQKIGYDWELLFKTPEQVERTVLADYRKAFPDEPAIDKEIIDNKKDLQYVADRINPEWIIGYHYFTGKAILAH